MKRTVTVTCLGNDQLGVSEFEKHCFARGVFHTARGIKHPGVK
jgi:hypothetical protein